jgi:GPN-loop GTPase
MRQFVDYLRALNFNICGVFIIDAQFLVDGSKFVSGVLSALSAMVNLEVRW